MSRFRFTALISIPVLLAFASCGGEDAAVPRRRAYPRIAIQADSIGRQEVLGNLRLRVNSAASFRRDTLREGWADLVYPASLGATFYLSLTHPASIPDAVANRRQRIALNLGGAEATAEEFHAGPWACTLVYSMEPGLTTPVQMLATSADGRLFNGVAVLRNPGNNADSIRPLIILLRDDARTMLNSLE